MIFFAGMFQQLKINQMILLGDKCLIQPWLTRDMRLLPVTIWQCCDGQCTVYEPGLCSQHDIGHSGTPEYTGPSDIVFNNCFQINLQTFTSKHNSQSTDKQQVWSRKHNLINSGDVMFVCQDYSSDAGPLWQIRAIIIQYKMGITGIKVNRSCILLWSLL